MSVGCSFCRERWKSQGWEGHCPHSTPEVLASAMARQEERIRTLEAEAARLRGENVALADMHSRRRFDATPPRCPARAQAQP